MSCLRIAQAGATTTRRRCTSRAGGTSRRPSAATSSERGQRPVLGSLARQRGRRPGRNLVQLRATVSKGEVAASVLTCSPKPTVLARSGASWRTSERGSGRKTARRAAAIGAAVAVGLPKAPPTVPSSQSAQHRDLPRLEWLVGPSVGRAIVAAQRRGAVETAPSRRASRAAYRSACLPRLAPPKEPEGRRADRREIGIAEVAIVPGAGAVTGPEVQPAQVVTSGILAAPDSRRAKRPAGPSRGGRARSQTARWRR